MVGSSCRDRAAAGVLASGSSASGGGRCTFARGAVFSLGPTGHDPPGGVGGCARVSASAGMRNCSVGSSRWSTSAALSAGRSGAVEMAESGILACTAGRSCSVGVGLRSGFFSTGGGGVGLGGGATSAATSAGVLIHTRSRSCSRSNSGANSSRSHSESCRPP